jgi:hypothetical protein
MIEIAIMIIVFGILRRRGVSLGKTLFWVLSPIWLRVGLTIWMMLL